MDYRNKLGVFTFDDDLSPTLAELVACTVMGQYFNPKPGEPSLESPQSCYDFIRERCGNVLATVGFELVINEKYYTPPRDIPLVEKIKLAQRMREERIAQRADADAWAEQALKLAFPGSYLVGPAAVK